MSEVWLGIHLDPEPPLLQGPLGAGKLCFPIGLPSLTHSVITWPGFEPKPQHPAGTEKTDLI